ncbi:MAG: amidohydrolase family protein [Hyphomonadaceae bacterium]
MMISADTHAGVRPSDYAKWLEPKYRDGVSDLIKHTEEFEKMVWLHTPGGASDAAIDPHGVLPRRAEGLWTAAMRLHDLESEGFVGEVIFPGDMATIGMYYSNLNLPCPPEYRAAGARAHNRFIADLCSLAPGRMRGVAQMEPWPDMQACVREIAWAKGADFAAISLPRFPGIEPNQPPLTSREWDPFWAACVDHDIAASIHIGHLHPQGSALPVMKAANLPENGFPDPAVNGDIHFDAGRRPLWQLIFSGVFDRFPTLRLSFTEIRCEWIAPTLAHLERRLDDIRFSKRDWKLPKLRPTEYWRRNCAVGAQIRPYEMSLRHQIGVENMLFGTDYPHAEGTWPNTREWLQLALAGVNEHEARLILGENSAKFYGFDAAALAPHVARVGLAPEEILGAHAVPQSVIDNLQWRGGFLSRAHRYDPDPVDPIMAEDERVLAPA